MHVRPVDLPELRKNLVEERDRVGPSSLAPLLPAKFRGLNGQDVAVRETTKLVKSDLYHVAPDMCGLARAAARTLPPFALEPADLPSKVGLAFFSEGIGGPLNEKTQERLNVHLICWQALTHGVVLGFYADTQSVVRYAAGPQAIYRDPRGHVAEKIFYGHVGIGWWGFGGEADTADIELNSALAECGPTLRATWLLMGQPVATVADAKFDRAARRRLPKGQEPDRVRVITLRRATSAGSGESDREYHHQWIVRGHWRQHWYPARQVHRPVWIAPHVKGPEGAPILGGEKVYSWTR